MSRRAARGDGSKVSRLSAAELDQLRFQLLAGLSEKAQELAERILPAGKQQGTEWRGHGPDGAKWGVVTRGAKRGWWRNFGTGQGGKDLLSFVRDGATDGDFRRAWHWAWDFIGGTPAALPERPDQPPAELPQLVNTGQAQWIRAAPFTWDGPAGLYLQGRGIDPARFDRPPNVLRTGVLWNQERGERMPAMLAAITDPMSRHFVALHRTYLEIRDGYWKKASVPTPKKTLGRMKGGLIVLARGASQRNWRDMLPGETLTLAEGIENALTLAQAWPENRAAAYIAAGNLLDLVLPVEIETVLLCRDRDGINPAISDTRGAMMAHWQREGRTVESWEPPRGYKDANDFLMGRAA